MASSGSVWFGARAGPRTDRVVPKIPWEPAGLS
jgi:hypothetical protein